MKTKDLLELKLRINNLHNDYFGFKQLKHAVIDLIDEIITLKKDAEDQRYPK